jgi:hypothetical protein
MRNLSLTILAVFVLLPTWSRSGLAESGKRQELMVRGIQRTLEQSEWADHFRDPQTQNSRARSHTTLSATHR